MKTRSVSLLLGVSVLLLSGLTVSEIFVNVSPNRAEFFTGEFVSLRCEGVQSSAEWTLKRKDCDKTETCGRDQQDFGLFDGSSCIILNLSPLSDGRFYWCEDKAGQKSPEVQIFVSDHVILEIPALPVMSGSDVTLSCRSRNKSYRLGTITRERLTGIKREVDDLPSTFTIHNVQRSDEGVYSCTATESDMVMISGQSRLMVRDPPPATTATTPTVPPTPPPPPPPPSVSVARLFCHLLVFCPFCICTGLMLSLYSSRRTAPPTGNAAVIPMETTPPVGEDYDDAGAAADVITESDLTAAQ